MVAQSPPSSASSPRNPSRTDPIPTVLTQSQRTANAYVTRAAEIIEQLSLLYSQLAFHKGSELRLRHDTIETQLLSGTNITTAREVASSSTQHHQVEILRIQSECDTLLLALAHCDRALTYWTEVS